MRAFVKRVLGPRPETDDAALLGTEIVTNAVVYSKPLPGTGLEVMVAHDDESVTVEVSAAGPFEFRAGDRAVEGGFGLRIVDALASRWGFESDERSRTRIWFVLAGSS